MRDRATRHRRGFKVTVVAYSGIKLFDQGEERRKDPNFRVELLDEMLLVVDGKLR